MEQRVQMIPNIAAIYRRNKIVEEKFIYTTFSEDVYLFPAKGQNYFELMILLH